MEPLTGRAIRDFKLRGNFLNLHSRRAHCSLDPAQPGKRAAYPGYSPPVVEYELEPGARGSVVVSDTDIPRLCQDDLELAKAHLALILNARGGDSRAAKELATIAQQSPGIAAAADSHPPAESRFVVPCTSCEAHSERDISQKGFILLKLIHQGYPVPDFVILTSQVYADRQQHLEEHLAEAAAQLQMLTRQGLGNSSEPLVFAMRCATPRYIPGVMDTYLNVGITETTFSCVEEKYGAAAARKMFLNNLKNLCNCLECEDCGALLSAIRWDLAPEQVTRLLDQLLDIVRRIDRRLTDDPLYQTAFLAAQAYKHFDANHDLLATLYRGPGHHPSLILQKMVCSVRHENAYAGVLSSRHTQMGLGRELQTAHNIFGEEMMTGIAEIEATAFEEPEAIKDRFPAVYHFAPHLAELEREFEAPVTIEFAVEATSRYQSFAMLQLNETGMSGRAAIISVMDLHKSGAISRQRVTQLIRPYHIKQLSSDTIDEETFSILNSFCTGVAVLPRSAVSVQIYFTGEAALTAKSRGEKACLCKKSFVPTDTVVMREMDAILSLTSAAIHVVTICQSLGIPALLSLEKNGVSLQDDKLVNAAGKEIREGDWITISSRRRAVYEGKAQYKPARLLRYLRGEAVQFDAGEKEVFDTIAYAYRYYQQLIKGLKVDQLSSLDEVTRLVNFELRGESEEAGKLVNSWFDERETLYVEEVLKSDIGDHLAQSRVFEMLTLDRKIRFFKRALAKCLSEQLSGYEAGAFMVGRFLSLRYPAAFWKRFTPAEIGLLVNEWVLFEKYMQVLHNMGERKVLHARKKILKEGLDELHLHAGNVQCLITVKLSGTRLEEARQSLPEWSDPQSAKVLELLQQPYRAFYDFNAKWSLAALEKICEEEKLPLPGPDDV
jgi:hypothetical protein